ncbi:MAG: AAA-like domain-containing protein [Prochloraceae cyanobacterium]|nr:AAA-like domain-containing protein [Prochloraceae cyanobacterium]
MNKTSEIDQLIEKLICLKNKTKKYFEIPEKVVLREDLKLLEELLKNAGKEDIEFKARVILIGALLDIPYEQIALELNLNNTYLGSQAAAKIWILINKSLKELGINQRIGKKNLRTIMELERTIIKTEIETLNNNYPKIAEAETVALLEEKAFNELKTREFELPEGALPSDSNIYIERVPIEIDCYTEIMRNGGLIRIKAPRQMGKTSLILRILEEAKRKKYCTVYLNFQELDRENLSELQLFLRSFCANVSDKLKMPPDGINNWTNLLGIKKGCHNYFERDLLPKTQSPLVLALDEFDRIFSEPEIAAEFFSILRTWHEEAKREENKIWKKLRLVLAYSTEAYLHYNINQSPFNVGLPISLPELTPPQIMELTQRYSLKLGGEEIQDLINALGGHPHLVQLAIYHLATNKTTFSDLLNTAHTEEGIYSSHLRRHLRNLEENLPLKKALCEVLKETQPVSLNSVEKFKLDGMGLVKLLGNKVTMRYQLYRQYFSEVL